MKRIILLVMGFAGIWVAVHANEPAVSHPSPRVISTDPPQVAEPQAPIQEFVTLSGTLHAIYDKSNNLSTLELRADDGGEYQIMLNPETRPLAQWNEKRVVIQGTISLEADVQWLNVETCNLSTDEL